MPTYEYECLTCGHLYEKFQSMTAAPAKRCPKCRHKVRRLLGTGAGIIFKGSGFYETDYRSRNYTEAARKEKTAAEAGSGKTEKKAETGSDGKTVTKSSTPAARETAAAAKK